MKKHLIALSLGTLALGIAEFCMMSILSSVATDLNVSIPQAGHFVSAYAAGVCIGALLMVIFARNLGLKTLLLMIVGFIFFGNALTVFAFDYWSMLGARLIAGLPHGAYFGVGAIVATQLAKKGEASKDVCLMVAGMTVANLIGVPLGSFLSWAVTWRLAFMIVAAVAALVFIGIKLWIPALPALPDYGFSAQFRFLTHLTPWLVLGAIGFGNGGFFAYYSYVNPIMENLASVPASLMSAVITLAGFGMVCGNLLAAKLSRRIGNAALACLGQAVLCCSLILLFFSAQLTWIAIALTVFAAGCVFFISGPEQVLILQNAKEGQLLAAAMGQVAFNFGNAVGAWLGGLPIEAGYQENWSCVPASVLAGIGFLLLFATWKIHSAKSAEKEQAQ